MWTHEHVEWVPCPGTHTGDQAGCMCEGTVWNTASTLPQLYSGGILRFWSLNCSLSCAGRSSLESLAPSTLRNKQASLRSILGNVSVCAKNIPGLE